MSQNWSDDRDEGEGEEYELPRSPRRQPAARQPQSAAPAPRPRSAPPTRPAPGPRTTTTVAARRASQGPPPPRDTFPLAVSAVVVLLIVGMLGVFMLNGVGSNGGTVQNNTGSAPTAVIAAGNPTLPPAAPSGNNPTTAPDEQALVPRMALEDFKKLYDNPATRPVILDVRAKEAFDTGHIQGAISFPEADLAARVGELPKDKLIVAYCQ